MRAMSWHSVNYKQCNLILTDVWQLLFIIIIITFFFQIHRAAGTLKTIFLNARK